MRYDLKNMIDNSNSKKKYDFRDEDFFKDLEKVSEESSYKSRESGAGPIYEVNKPIDGEDLLYNITLDFIETYNGTKKEFQYFDPSSRRNKKLTVDIPKGIKDKQKLRLVGKGMPGLKGGTPGDLYISVNVRNNGIFKFKGDDLYLVHDIPYSTAIFGGIVSITGLEKKLKITVPPNTKDHTLLRLKNQGFYNIKDDVRGNLLIKINIKIPDKINDEQKKLIKSLQYLGL